MISGIISFNMIHTIIIIILMAIATQYNILSNCPHPITIYTVIILIIQRV